MQLYTCEFCFYVAVIAAMKQDITVFSCDYRISLFA